MNVIPVINCEDAACAQNKIDAAKNFLPADGLLHFDITDGLFSSHKTWNDPAGWASLNAPFGLELHLMVEHPETYIAPWIAAGVKRFIIHVETVTLPVAQEISRQCAAQNVAVMISSVPATGKEELASFLGWFSAFQVLAVPPGAAGQEFSPSVLGKISFLRQAAPNAIIEVDGGMNPQTAALVKAAGADTIVSATYIFGAPDPKIAYEDLKGI